MDDPGTDTLRKLAPCWSLAGDERLLTILQNTHQRLLAKCQEANTHLEEMVTTLDDASISLQNVNNQFMALSSSQFIESRVYDDDDADIVPDASTVKESPKPPAPDELTILKRSIAVIENSHEIITILNDSDTESDSDDDLPDRMVLKPKDVYSDRPLPYIIGSEPWKSKWHAGLMQEDSDTDSSTSKLDRESDQYSQSENEDFHQEVRGDGRAAVGQHIRNISETSSDLPSEATPTSKPTPSDVASEIARRLGAGVPPKMATPEPDEESPAPAVRKVYKPQEPVVGNIFSDSPPPLDASDSDTDIFAGLQRQQPYKQTNTYAPTDLFGDEDQSDDGDIFSDFAKQPPPTKPTSLFDAGPKPNMFNKPAALPTHVEQPGTRTNDLVDEQSIEASGDNATVASKKPIGGISLFGSNKGTESIGAAILKRNQRKSSTSGDDSGNDVTEPLPPKQEHAKKERDIFDDLFAKSESKKVKPKAESIVKEIKQTVQKQKEDIVKKETPKAIDLFSDNLFDDIDDIFTSTIVTSKKDKPKSIFEDDDGLFSEIAEPKTVKPEVKNNDSKEKKGLFDSDDDLFVEPVTNRSVVCNKPVTAPKIENAARTSETTTKIHEKPNNIREPTKVTKEISIFDDDEEDDLFSGIKTTKDNNVANKVQNAPQTNFNQDVATSKNVFKSPSLFDDDDDSELFVEPAKSTKDIEKNIKVSKATPNKLSIKQATDHSNKDIFSKLDSKETEAKTVVEEAKINTDFTPPILVTNNVLEEKTVKNDDNIVQETTKSIEKDIQDIASIEKSSESSNSCTAKESVNSNNININTNSLAIHKLLADNYDKMSDEEFSEQGFDEEPIQESKPAQNVIGTIIPETEEKIPEITSSIFEKPGLEAGKIFTEATDSIPEINDNKLLSNVAEVPIVPDVSKANTSAPSIFDNSPLDEDIFAPPSFIKSESVNTKIAKNSTTDIDNNTAKDIFTDILTEPPVFEKPKEPKKSKNVNALFDDDSDDETLFFKKDDVITDEKPEDFTAKQDRLFGLFTDEPPDVNFTKINDDLDDDLFSTHPKPKLVSESKSVTSIEDNFDVPLPETPKLDDEITYTNKKLISPETSKMSDSEIKESIDEFKQPEKESSRSSSVKELTRMLDDHHSFKEPTSLISVTESQSVFSDDDEELCKSLPVHLSQPANKIIPKHEESDEELYSSLQYIKSSLENTTPKPKILDSSKSMFKIPSEKPVRSEVRKVGKLKLGLNINVNALLPGAAPRKVKPVDNIDGQTQSQVESPKDDPIEPKTVGFDAKPESEILDNKLSKERPRIQVKRRPSSRKARREAVRKSGIDFGEDSTDNSSSFDDPPKSQSEVINQKDVEISNEVKVDDNEDIVKNIEVKPLDRTKIEPKITESDSKPIQVETEAVNEEIPAEIEPVKPPVKSDSTTKIKYILNDEDIFNTSPTENLAPKTTATIANDNVTKTTDIFGSDSPIISSKVAKNTESTDSDIFGAIVPNRSENSAKIQDSVSDIFSSSAPKSSVANETDSAIKTIGQTYQKTDKKKKTKSLFGEDEHSDDDDEIFKNKKPAAKTNVFDSDSEGELFGVTKKVEKVDKVEKFDKVEKKKVEVKGSLFGDEEDDDDLFGVKTKKSTAEPHHQPPRSTPAAKEPLKSAQPVFEDPLSMFGDDD